MTSNRYKSGVENIKVYNIFVKFLKLGGQEFNEMYDIEQVFIMF